MLRNRRSDSSKGEKDETLLGGTMSPVPRKKINWGGCICFFSIVAFVLGVVAVVLAVVSLNSSSALTTQRTYETSLQVLSSPYQAALGSASALAMTLPNDLTDYVGHRYTINAVTPHAHTVQIDAGSLSTTWDGASTKATLGGANGDGFTFYVVQKDLIRVENEKNVVFSP